MFGHPTPYSNYRLYEFSFDIFRKNPQNKGLGHTPKHRFRKIPKNPKFQKPLDKSEPLLGFRLEAIYHTAIVVYGKEYYYGGGISGTGINELDRPGTTQLGKHLRCSSFSKRTLF